jgi:hypothetical protein
MVLMCLYVTIVPPFYYKDKVIQFPIVNSLGKVYLFLSQRGFHGGKVEQNVCHFRWFMLDWLADLCSANSLNPRLERHGAKKRKKKKFSY